MMDEIIEALEKGNVRQLCNSDNWDIWCWNCCDREPCEGYRLQGQTLLSSHQWKAPGRRPGLRIVQWHARHSRRKGSKPMGIQNWVITASVHIPTPQCNFTVNSWLWVLIHQPCGSGGETVRWNCSLGCPVGLAVRKECREYYIIAHGRRLLNGLSTSRRSGQPRTQRKLQVYHLPQRIQPA